MWIFIAFFALAMVAFAAAPLAARGDKRSGYRTWGLVGLLCAAAVGLLVDLAVNPHAYAALMHIAGA